MRLRRANTSDHIKNKTLLAWSALLLFTISLVTSMIASFAVAAGSASLSISAACGTSPLDRTFTVSVFEDSGNTPVNAVQSHVTFDKAKLEYVSSDASSGAFTVVAVNSGDNSAGTVTLELGASGGTNPTGKKLVANITFHTIGEGDAAIAFDNNNSFVLQSSDNSALPTTTSGSSYYVYDPANLPSTLNAGQQLTKGHLLAGGNFTLIFQCDGNVVLYNGAGSPLWYSRTSGTTANRLVMQTDGNLVLYNSSNVPLWYTQTNGTGSSKVVLQADGNLVVYNSSNKAFWASGTNLSPDRLYGGQQITAGQQITSGGSLYRLVLQTDGNLVLYNSSNVPQWNTQTNGKGANRLVMQTDGNLVLYNSSNVPLWHAGTNGAIGGHVIMQSDGNLVVYNLDKKPLWWSKR